MQTKLLTVFALAAIATVHGMPQAVKRDATATTSTAVIAATSVPQVQSGATSATPAFVNDDGTEDLAAIWAAFDAVPDLVQVPQEVSNVTVVTNPDALTSIVSAQTNNIINAATTDSSSSSGDSVEKRDTTSNWAGYAQCGKQLTSMSGLKVGGTDTVNYFETFTSYANNAKKASTPDGFVLSQQNRAQSYEAPSFNTGNHELSSYDPSACAAYCNTDANCNSFTMYYERDPSIAHPGDLPPSCGNPPSITKIGCQTWSSIITSTTTMNSGGQWQGNYFYVTKAGVNAYTRPSVPDAKPLTNYKVTTLPAKIDNQKVVGKILFTAVLKTAYFDAANCKAAADKFGNAAASFETWRAVRGGAEVGQGCIVLSEAGWTSNDAHDAGQWYTDTNGVSQYSGSTPVYFYEKTG